MAVEIRAPPPTENRYDALGGDSSALPDRELTLIFLSPLRNLEYSPLVFVQSGALF